MARRVSLATMVDAPVAEKLDALRRELSKRMYNIPVSRSRILHRIIELGVDSWMRELRDDPTVAPVDQVPKRVLLELPPPAASPKTTDLVIRALTERGPMLSREIVAAIPSKTTGAISGCLFSLQSQKRVFRSNDGRYALTANEQLARRREPKSRRVVRVESNDDEEERDAYAPWSLVDRHQTGDRRATDELLRRNEAACWTVAHKCHRRARQMDIEDLVQQARIGLLEGFDKCDREKSNGAKPMTYAINWARHSVQRYVEDHRSDVRVPVGAQSENGRRRRVDRWPWLLVQGESLDAPVGVDSNNIAADAMTLHQVLASPDDVDDLREQAFCEDLSTEMMTGALHGRVADIIARRFGLNGYEPQTRLEIANAPPYRCSRERIRQLEVVGLRALRAYAQRRGLGWDMDATRSVPNRRDADRDLVEIEVGP